MSDNSIRTVIPFPGTYKPPTPPPVEWPTHTAERGIVGGPCGLNRHAALVDARARRVQCAKCKVDLDPFEILGDVARYHEQHTWLLEENGRLVKLKGQLEEEVKRLRDQRNRLRRTSKPKVTP